LHFSEGGKLLENVYESVNGMKRLRTTDLVKQCRTLGCINIWAVDYCIQCNL